MPNLSVKNLTKRYGENLVLDDLSLELNEAGVWALVAPNGTGKTTFLDCITNLITYQSGKITVNGIDNKNNVIFKKLSYLQDASILFPNLTGKDHLKFVANIQKLPKNRINEIVTLTKIEKFYKRPVKTYSLGMKQRLLLAISLINNPEVLLLDEPFNGLDPSSQIELRVMLKEIAQKGTLVILSTHFLGEISQLTDRLMFLKDKKIVKKIVEDEFLVYAIDTTSNEYALELLSPFLVSGSIEEDVIVCQFKRDCFDSAIKTIQQNGIKLIKIREHINASEQMYQRLFAE
ncbi:MAG: ABC transporter ATP-binding protein [Peptoniphilaceae bacterium]|uniref:ABC transporter ATP-binding protein n=1 Tax=Parvimonas sp. TaxID=1944660 RepID=UPI0025D5AC70|nr:ABC transporter ATP-binding protein [Parvimonas sp.]MCI5996911.1 ABC transporter ATP-binding protein [Parvimonas sp.]MDD7764996.1 ABC transporter ATP-binding protein [Peptoniphilaceae bacterium]MDY3050320.1 ABC transporter ATP-binding protein [Parvimonas sp.]